MTGMAPDKDSASLDLAALEDLVLGYLQHEELIECASSSTCKAAGRGRAVQEVCETVRKLVNEGQVTAAMTVAASLNTSVLEDLRLVFRLKKQQLVEFLREGNQQADMQALECVRQELATLALDAYPEAYHEFKRCMLLFVYGPDAMDSPVADLWSAAAREGVASLLCRTLRQAAGVEESRLAVLAAYLALTHRSFRVYQGSGTPEQDLADALLLEGRDAAPLPPHGVRGCYDEEDIQALAQAVDLSREGAIDALKVADGDVVAALRAELCSLRLNKPLLTQLAWEFAADRDLLQMFSPPAAAASTHASSGPTPPPTPTTSTSSGASLQPSAMELDASQQSQPHAEPAEAAGGREGEERPDVSTSSPPRSPWEGPPQKMPRWLDRGDVLAANASQLWPALAPRQPGLGEGDDAFLARMSDYMRATTRKVVAELLPNSGRALTTKMSAAMHEGKQQAAAAGAISRVESAKRYAVLFRVRQLAEAGRLQEAEAAISEAQPGLLASHPAVTFQLARCEFGWRLRAGDTLGALGVARSRLTPLAEANPALLPQVKATMAALLTGGAASTALPPAPAALVTALREALGLQVARLVGLLQELVRSHTNWFRLQRCRDRFEGPLCLDALKGSAPPPPPPPSDAAADGPTPAADAAEQAPPGGGGEEQQPEQESEEEYDGEVTEAAILLTMEFSGLPRAQCIELLIANENDPHAVMASLFP